MMMFILSRRPNLLLVTMAATMVVACHGFMPVMPPLSFLSRSSSSLSFSNDDNHDAIRVKQVRKAIDGLNRDNFYPTLQKIEPFLLKDAGTTAYAKCMHRIQRMAKVLGVEVPAKYAFEAVATTKRRDKQTAFIQNKEEARVAEEAKAVEEAAAAAAAAAEAEVKAKEEAAALEAQAKAAAEAEEAARAAEAKAAAPAVVEEASPVEVTAEQPAEAASAADEAVPA